jgi:DNA invertase Pin-like site-specific DNA recombinase
MMRTATYARFSTQMQREASIEDQERLCRERAEREGWQVIASFADRAVSGASMMRPGLQALIEGAMAGRFDVVVAEALDRLSRDQADVAALYKRLSFAGVRIVTLAEGEITELHVGLKGTMNQLFLKDLADKTRRGLRGRVEAGLSGGSNSHGYDVTRRTLPDGSPATGERAINRREAAIVVRIFQNYAAGISPRAIAAALNRERVIGPRGGSWSASTIHGNWARGTGILNNELYIGRLVWNRLRYVKDPITGNRVSRPNPEARWVIKEVPELRIVDGDLWALVKARQAAAALPRVENRGSALSRANRPRHLFSGMLTCGVCGGGVSMISATHLGCSAARNKATCDNRRSLARSELEARVLGALSTRLMDPKHFAVFCAEFTADTKWKRMTPRIDDPKQGVSQADVYQLMAYGRLYDCPNVVLLYPHHGDLPPDPIRRRYSIATRGADESLIVATQDLTGKQRDHTEALRQFVMDCLARESAPEAPDNLGSALFEAI